MINPKEIKTTRLHLFGQDPLSNAVFHPEIPMTDSSWLNSTNALYENLKCPRTIGSSPKNDMEELEKITPSLETSLLSLNFILNKSNYTDYEWDNPKNPQLGKNKVKAPYNLALGIINHLSQKNHLWAAAVPETRNSETWRTYKSSPEEEKNANGLAKDLKPKLVSPKDITLILSELENTFHATPEFQAELLVYNKIGLEVFGKKYFVDNSPFICPIVGEDETYGVVNWEGPLLIANTSFLKLLRDDPNKAEELYEKAREQLFFYKAQDCEQDEYDLNHFRSDYPKNINLLTNPTLAIKKE